MEDIIKQLDNLKKEEPRIIVLNYLQLHCDPIDGQDILFYRKDCICNLILDLRTAPINTPIFAHTNGPIYNHICILVSQSYGNGTSIPNVFLKLRHLNSYFNTQLREIGDSDDEYYLIF